MGRFYTSTTNTRGKAINAMSHKGQVTHSRGWNIGVKVVSKPDSLCKELDSFEIYVTYGSNGGLDDVYLGTVIQMAGGPKFIKPQGRKDGTKSKSIKRT